MDKLHIDRLRIDKWLWAARFFKTRSLANQEVHAGRVQVNGTEVKASRELRVGDQVRLVQSGMARTVLVKGLNEQRGSATLAQQLYEETPESQQQRQAEQERRRLSPEPAHSIAGGRPTKRDRRELQKDWGSRWSTSLD